MPFVLENMDHSRLSSFSSPFLAHYRLSNAALERSGMAVRVHLIIRHFILHYLVIFNSKSSSIATNFDAELIKDVAVS
jgi:hypothetical protein